MLNKRQQLQETLGCEPSQAEWASALDLSEQQLVQRLKLLAPAGRTLVESNQLFISWCVIKYQKAAGMMGMEASDLFQEGALGYLK